MTRRALALALALLAAACRTPAPQPPLPSAEPAAAQEARLVVRDYWEAVLERWPTYATFLGDERYNGRLEELGPEARAEWLERLAQLERRARSIRAADLAEADRVTLELLKLKLSLEREEHRHRFHEWSVDQMDGPQSWFAQTMNFTRLLSEKDASDLEERLGEYPRYFRQYVGELEAGLQSGRVAPRLAVERVLGQLDGYLSMPPPESPWGEKILKMPDMYAGSRRRLMSAVKESVYPALDRLRGFLKERYLPRSRAENVGLGFLPGGAKAYRFKIRAHTTLDLTADELHALGLSELEKIRGEMRAIARRMGHEGELSEFLAKARSDPANFFAEREEVEAAAQEQMGRAYALLPEYFGRLPKTECVVKRIEPYREKDAVAAFYYQPPEDLSRPGIYYINTFDPSTRPRYGMAALAAHEAVPGHHLQIALALETDLPPFRRHAQFTAFTEGWGLYAERLADEMGLYRDDLERFGMLTYQAWRACRLVVDTGLHAKGWPRERAVEFMSANAPLSREEIVNEVDRYIIWPGQALAYMVGQRELLRLRGEAERRLGPEFRLAEFHDVVLKNGSIPLATLRKVVDSWLGSKAPAAAPAGKP